MEHETFQHTKPSHEEYATSLASLLCSCAHMHMLASWPPHAWKWRNPKEQGSVVHVQASTHAQWPVVCRAYVCAGNSGASSHIHNGPPLFWVSVLPSVRRPAGLLIPHGMVLHAISSTQAGTWWSKKLANTVLSYPITQEPQLSE